MHKQVSSLKQSTGHTLTANVVDQLKPSAFFKPFNQPRLSINKPNDIYEQESDAIAERVMRMPAAEEQNIFFRPGLLPVFPVQRKCADCEREEKKIQMKEDIGSIDNMSGNNSLHEINIREKKISNYPSGQLAAYNSPVTMKPGSNEVQRQVSTLGGTWDTEEYRLRKDFVQDLEFPESAGIRGVDVKIVFTPGPNVNAELIGLTQTVRSYVNNLPSFSSDTRRSQSINFGDAIINKGTGETDEGTSIDKEEDLNNPIYPVLNKSSNSLDDMKTAKGFGQHGSKIPGVPAQDAILIDHPTRSDAAKNSGQTFETAALATKGVQAGTYYGSVQWGWKTDSAGVFTLNKFEKANDGTPSSSFLKAGALWNAGLSSTRANTVDLPIYNVKIIKNRAGADLDMGPAFIHLPFGTRVIEWPLIFSLKNSLLKRKIQVEEGPFIGKTGEVSIFDLKDERP